MKKPVYVFYYNNHNHKSAEDFDQIKSVSSNPTDAQTYRSSASSKNHLHRLNEIKPKPKINIPKPSKDIPKKITKVYTQPDGVEQPQMLISSKQDIDEHEKKRKGIFSWAKMAIFCGMNRQVESSEGCTCSQPCKFSEQMTKSHQQSDFQAFYKLKSLKPASQSFIQIEKDLERTYTNNLTYTQNRAFKEMLRVVLTTYSVYDVELGYVQGINNLAAILLYHIKNQQLTFWALVQLMEYQQLRNIYLGKLQQLDTHSTKIQHLINKHLNSLYRFAIEMGIIFKSVLYGWLLSLMSKIVPLEHMHIVLTNFKQKGWNYIYQVIIQFLRVMKDCLMVSEDESQFLMNLNLSEQSCNQLNIEWPYILNKAKENC